MTEDGHAVDRGNIDERALRRLERRLKRAEAEKRSLEIERIILAPDLAVGVAKADGARSTGIVDERMHHPMARHPRGNLGREASSVTSQMSGTNRGSPPSSATAASSA